MIVDKRVAGLICELEMIVGENAHNSSSYNGYTGEEGADFRYPVHYSQSKKDLKTRNMVYGIDPECVSSMHYEFGANCLYIGRGLIDVLKHLEERYEIDFNELEEKISEKQNKELSLLEDKLRNGKKVKISSGTKKVGEGIPTGVYRVSYSDESYSRFCRLYIRDEYGELVDYMHPEEEIVLEFNEGGYIESDEDYYLEMVKK